MIVEQKFFIGMQDVGANYKATNRCLLEMLSNVATVHAMQVGQSAMDVDRTGMVWMVINWKLEVLKRPSACETVTARTWAVGWNRLQAFRDFDILDAEGCVIAKASSVWVALDPAHVSFVRLSDDNMAVYEEEADRESFPGEVFAKVREKDYRVLAETNVRILRNMIDCNNHVHNTAYLDLVNEVLPEGLEETCFDRIEISYRKEALLHEEVRVEYAERTGGGEEAKCVFVHSADGSTLHTVILLSKV